MRIRASYKFLAVGTTLLGFLGTASLAYMGSEDNSTISFTGIVKRLTFSSPLFTLGWPALPSVMMFPIFLGTAVLEKRLRERIDTLMMQRRGRDEEPGALTLGRERLDVALIGSTLRRVDDDDKLGYAGTERVNRILMQELVSRGHSVTYFGPGDSKVAGNLVPTVDMELWSDPRYKKETSTGKAQMFLDSVKMTFDIVHEYAKRHPDTILHFSVDESLRDKRFDGMKTVAAIHGDTSVPAMQQLFSDARVAAKPVIFVSQAQRSHLPHANAVGVVHNATTINGANPSYKKGDYFVEVCRLSPEKSPHIPLLIAEQLRMPIEVIGPDPHTPSSEVYLREVFWPIYNRVHAEGYANYRGKLPTHERDSIVKGAAAGFALSGMYTDDRIQPHRYVEAFGLTSIEYQKLGTPAINSAYGACPETVQNGITGYVCRDQDEALWAARQVLRDRIDRHDPPRFVRDRFSPHRMTDGYELAYRLVENEHMRELARAAYA